PGERRDDYVKGRHIRLSRLCQWLDESEELDDRPGPAVNEHQRYSVRARRALMNEVNLLAVNLHRELIKLVDPRLLGSPVISFLPVDGEIPDLLDICAVFPVCGRELVGPLCTSEPTAEIREHGVCNMHLERTNPCLVDLRLGAHGVRLT